MRNPPRIYPYRLLAVLAAAACLLSIVDGLVPQLQMIASGGRLLLSNVVTKLAFLGCLIAGAFLHPRISYARVPTGISAYCIAFLALEIPYFVISCNLSLPDVLQAYNSYYLLLLIGPATLVFRGAVSERLLIAMTLSLFFASAIVGFTQFATSSPVLYTESADGGFTIQSWDFYEKVRAFGLFTSGLNFGIYCSLSGALGVALLRKRPLAGSFLTLVSALACYTTMTRLCYLLFVCASTYSAVITFGRKRSRGLWQPIAYFVLGVSTILLGLRSLDADPNNKLQSTSSLVDRLIEWTYYWDLLKNSTLVEVLLGRGLVQNDKLIQSVPVVIDNAPLALVLHIGVVGLLLFTFLMIRMWLFLRKEAIAQQRPFLTAAASLWATFICAGTFNIIFASFGSVFALAILCDHRAQQVQRVTPGADVSP